jgi:NAD(P)-dependent dehydrogenase (short-subunit alcohol dehydrogenase family)
MEWNRSVWESDLEYGLHLLRLAVDTHAITSHFAIPLLIETPGGLVVEVTDGTNAYNAINYRVSFFYDVAKAAVNRMAFALAHELKPQGATAVSLTPGWLRSEAMLDAYRVTESNWRDGQRSSRTSQSRKVRPLLAEQWPHSLEIPTCHGGTGNRCPVGSLRESTDLPISMAANPMLGDMSSKFRM